MWGIGTADIPLGRCAAGGYRA